MARISTYEQNKIISQLVNVPGVDNSGLQFANTVANSAEKIATIGNAVANRNYAANQQINQEFIGNLAYGLRQRQYYANQQAAHAQALANQVDVAEKSVGMAIALDDAMDTARKKYLNPETREFAPHLAKQEFRAAYPGVIKQFMEQNPSNPDVAAKLIQHANSYAQSGFSKLDDYGEKMNDANLRYRVDNTVADLRDLAKANPTLENLKDLNAKAEALHPSLFNLKGPEYAKSEIAKARNGLAQDTWFGMAERDPRGTKQLMSAFKDHMDDPSVKDLSEKDWESIGNRVDSNITKVEHEENEARQIFDAEAGKHMDDIRYGVTSYQPDKASADAARVKAKLAIGELNKYRNDVLEKLPSENAQDAKLKESLIAQNYAHIKDLEMTQHNADVVNKQLQAETERGVREAKALEKEQFSNAEKAIREAKTAARNDPANLLKLGEIDGRFNQYVEKKNMKNVTNEGLNKFRQEYADLRGSGVMTPEQITGRNRAVTEAMDELKKRQNSTGAKIRSFLGIERMKDEAIPPQFRNDAQVAGEMRRRYETKFDEYMAIWNAQPGTEPPGPKARQRMVDAANAFAIVPFIDTSMPTSQKLVAPPTPEEAVDELVKKAGKGGMSTRERVLPQ